MGFEYFNQWKNASKQFYISLSGMINCLFLFQQDGNHSEPIRMLVQHLVRLQATVVDGETVAHQAEQLRKRALASAESLQAKADLARKKEDERVAGLKRQRGEEWLPSVAVQIAKEIAKEPKLPKAAAPAIVLAPEETITDAPPKKKKRKKKVSKAKLGIVVD